MSADATGFAGSVPQLYDTHLVPLIFEPYATDLVARLAKNPPRRILEIAAGTGAVTRAMAAAFPETTALVATDLNQPMLDCAAARGTTRDVTWRQADVMELPFADGSFDAVVCQFGVMFFQDRARAHAEVRRVLAPRGTYVFNVWDRLEENEFADWVTSALATRYPADPPRFLARMPYGYSDKLTIERDLAAGGFTRAASVETVASRSRGTAEQASAGYCMGTPLRGEIEAREPGGLVPATIFAADTVAERVGRGSVDRKIQAHVVTIEK